MYADVLYVCRSVRGRFLAFVRLMSAKYVVRHTWHFVFLPFFLPNECKVRER